MSPHELERLKDLVQGDNHLDEPIVAEVKSEIRSSDFFLFDEAMQRTRPSDK